MPPFTWPAAGALQRARAGLREHPPQSRTDWRPKHEPTDEERRLHQRYVAATEQGDIDALTTVLHDDLRFSMPPHPGVWDGRDTVVQAWVADGYGTESFGSLRCLLTRANGRPALAAYARTPNTDEYRPLTLDVLRIEDGLVREIYTFDGRLLAHFGLPATL
jgi:RNA polymerase sigma-70 factor (ECF subfamily)